jgi:hypothetical protein
VIAGLNDKLRSLARPARIEKPGRRPGLRAASRRNEAIVEAIALVQFATIALGGIGLRRECD